MPSSVLVTYTVLGLPEEVEPGVTLISRNQSTLEVLGEIPVYDSMRWSRRDVGAGSFTLTLSRRSVDRSLVAPGRVIEVRRGGSFEFAGVITDEEIDSDGDIRTLSGPDLKGWFLERRIIGRTAEQARSGPGETVMKNYVSTADDPFADELSVQWNVEADVARGSVVDFTALRRNLLTEVLVPVARRSGLWHDVVILTSPDRYEYRVFEVSDSTSATGALPFSLGWDNVGQIVYRASIRGVPNDLTVLGDGSGDSRSNRRVEDSDHITTYGRTHGALDLRDATTDAELDEAGETAISDAIRESVTVTATPLLGDRPGARYRTDWDIGRVVTVAIPEEEISVDRLVVGVDFSLERRGSDVDEQIQMHLGDLPHTLPQLIARDLRRRNRASFQ